VIRVTGTGRFEQRLDPAISKLSAITYFTCQNTNFAFSNHGLNMSSALSDNPILNVAGIPAYATITAEHVESGIKEMLKRAGSLLQSVEENSENSWDDLMVPMEQIDLLYEYGWSPVRPSNRPKSPRL
jgi:hypothetical protein